MFGSLNATNNNAIVAPFPRSEFIDHLSWGFAETASPQALMLVAFGDEELQNAVAMGVLTQPR